MLKDGGCYFSFRSRENKRKPDKHTSWNLTNGQENECIRQCHITNSYSVPTEVIIRNVPLKICEMFCFILCRETVAVILYVGGNGR